MDREASGSLVLMEHKVCVEEEITGNQIILVEKVWSLKTIYAMLKSL